MKKPASTLVDRPGHRDWTIWLAGVFVAVAHLWDVVDIYILDRRIYGVLGLQGSVMTLLAELLFAAMTATFVVVVLTTSRRVVRKWRYERYLKQNVTILASPVSDRRTLRLPTPQGAPVSLTGAGEPDGFREGTSHAGGDGLPSPRPRPALVRLHFNGDQSGASTAAERSVRSRG